jgi:hypothetical protein
MSMELGRLANFNLTHIHTANRSVHLFAAVPKQQAEASGGRKAAAPAVRYFAR